MTLRICLLLLTSFLVVSIARSQVNSNHDIKQVAISLYSSFSKLQNISGRLNFIDSSRLKWDNLPVGLSPRAGTSIGNMTEDQRKLLHRILSVSLSSQGYLKATSIIHLDDLLNSYYERLFYKKEINERVYTQLKGLQWSHKNFYFAFYGNPSDSVWGYKLEGHHLSVNFTFVNKNLSVTPFFIGTDPAEYPDTEYAGWRVLGQEEDLGIKLINLLTPAQQKKATMNRAVPGDIITAAGSGKRLVEDWGIRGADLNATQKGLMQYIIREFIFNLEYDKAIVEYEKILKAGIDKVYFGWIGKYNEKDPHYYVLNGPTFLIEFDNASGNHIHAIWREKGNEFGEDLLRKHYQNEKHSMK
jgi:hypothetical protein